MTTAKRCSLHLKFTQTLSLNTCQTHSQGARNIRPFQCHANKDRWLDSLKTYSYVLPIYLSQVSTPTSPALLQNRSLCLCLSALCFLCQSSFIFCCVMAPARAMLMLAMSVALVAFSTGQAPSSAPMASPPSSTMSPKAAPAPATSPVSSPPPSSPSSLSPSPSPGPSSSSTSSPPSPAAPSPESSSPSSMPDAAPESGPSPSISQTPVGSTPGSGASVLGTSFSMLALMLGGALVLLA